MAAEGRRHREIPIGAVPDCWIVAADVIGEGLLLEAERRAIVTAHGMSYAIRLLPIKKSTRVGSAAICRRAESCRTNAAPREDETVRRGPLFAAALRAMRTANGVTDGDKRAAEKEVRANVIRHRSSFMTRARGLLKIRSQMSTISKAAGFLPVHILGRKLEREEENGGGAIFSA